MAGTWILDSPFLNTHSFMSGTIRPRVMARAALHAYVAVAILAEKGNREERARNSWMFSDCEKGHVFFIAVRWPIFLSWLSANTRVLNS